ncbi:hypothetical protein EVAR_23468_1 [Eumeta japonica]|uniref:Mariner Mos1 transposase n=1 Tax=Eumeta variegata TaxID=151549 RepID=A0A4C1UKU1_EUMVA|nr:hypothetical protein EVAR_23468_1 [Eumeta japonica]
MQPAASPPCAASQGDAARWRCKDSDALIDWNSRKFETLIRDGCNSTAQQSLARLRTAFSDEAPFSDWHLVTFLFAKIKNQSRGQRFSSPEEAVEEYEKHVSEVTREEWHKCFQNWFIEHTITGQMPSHAPTGHAHDPKPPIMVGRRVDTYAHPSGRLCNRSLGSAQRYLDS